MQKDKKSLIKSSPSTELIQNPYKEEVEDPFDIINVTEDSSLRDYIVKTKKLSYDRGCAYYELDKQVGIIDSGKEVILMDKVSNIIIIMDLAECADVNCHLNISCMHTILQKGKLFTDQAAARKIRTVTSVINLRDPGLPAYSKVFIRCNGPGHNVYIKKGTSVLYKVKFQ